MCINWVSVDGLEYSRFLKGISGWSGFWKGLSITAKATVKEFLLRILDLDILGHKMKSQALDMHAASWG